VLHADDRRTLALVTAPLSLLLRSFALADQVKAARTATIQARERERAILHRDLHDGLGPTLTGAALRADAAGNLLHSDPDAAAELLSHVGTDVRTALSEVRRVVYGLRPLELEERGLLGALRHRAAQGGKLPVRLDAPARMPDLSPATELAAYRVLSEAITNAQRHSAGTAITVSISVGGDLTLEVSDDGALPTSWRPGVGIASMQERVEELGGTATIGPDHEHWVVRARLPL
jgi:signal transduction histidine kinase